MLSFSDLIHNFDKYTYQHCKGVIFNLKASEQANFNAINQNSMILQNIPAPYLPPMDKTKHQYTIVLDLDETLVHFVNVYPIFTVRTLTVGNYLLDQERKGF